MPAPTPAPPDPPPPPSEDSPQTGTPGIPSPVITADFEFGFQHVAPQYVTAVEGRDTIALEPGKLLLQLHPDEFTTEEVTINLNALAYLRKVVRVTPAPTVADDPEAQLTHRSGLIGVG